MHYNYHLYTYDDTGKEQTIGEPFTNEKDAIHASYRKSSETVLMSYSCEREPKYPNGVFIAKTKKK